MLKSFLLDIAVRDNSPIILVTFETILNAGIIENAVMKSTLKSSHVDYPLQTVSSPAGSSGCIPAHTHTPFCANVFLECDLP